MTQKIYIRYAGMPEQSEFTDEPLTPPGGKTVEKTVILDEYHIFIIAPQEAAERFQRWLKRAVIQHDDYREMLLPMFTPTQSGEPTYFPLIGEEGWIISSA